MKILRQSIIAASLLVVSACGGGGGSTSGPVPTITSSPASAIAQFVIGSGQSIQSVKRNPDYLAPTTQSIAVYALGVESVINIGQGAPGCSGTLPNLVCTLNMTVPVGNDAFQIIAYNAPNANGSVLSASQVGVNIVPGTNVVHAVLNGVVNHLTMGNVFLPEAVATSVPLPISVEDADGNVIVGPGVYDSAVTLSNSDTSGATSLSSTTLAAPGPITVSYDGHTQPSAGAAVTASDPNVGGLQAVGPLLIVPQYTEYAIPSGRTTTGAMAVAPDNSLWFGEGGTPFGVSAAIGHSTASGQITEFPFPGMGGLASYASPSSMAIGPDGNIWYVSPAQFGGGDAIVRMDAAGNYTAFTTGIGSRVGLIAIGPDKGIWYTYLGGAGTITTSGTITNYTAPSLAGGGQAHFDAIASGPDGNLWFAESSQGALFRMTTSGQYTEFPMPAPGGVALSPTALAASSTTLYVVASQALYTVDPSSGSLTEVAAYPSWGAGSFSNPAFASNGALWSATGQVWQANVINRLSTSGAMTTVWLPLTSAQQYPNSSGITGLAGTSDANMWFSLGSSIGKIVVR